MTKKTLNDEGSKKMGRKYLGIAGTALQNFGKFPNILR